MSREEYPRPQFGRENWLSLNGEWQFAFDDQNLGLKEKWYTNEANYPYKINVPFVYQSALSGIDHREVHDVVWYYRTFDVQVPEKSRVLLHFGAVDYEADVFVNGNHVKNHCGGHTSFAVDITDALVSGQEQILSVRAFDPHFDESIPRGKQFWEEESAGIWYTNSTGIWQPVWLEVVAETHLQQVKFTSDFDAGAVKIDVELNQLQPQVVLEYQIYFKDALVTSGKADFITSELSFAVDIFQQEIFRTNFHHEGWSWTPEKPQLFDVELTLREAGNAIDQLKSYFGMRKIHTENGMIYLNNKPYYQKLVLDQGYWPSGLLTAPTDEDFKQDILLAKEMGFNGCRKHQKTHAFYTGQIN